MRKLRYPLAGIRIVLFGVPELARRIESASKRGAPNVVADIRRRKFQALSDLQFIGVLLIAARAVYPGQSHGDNVSGETTQEVAMHVISHMLRLRHVLHVVHEMAQRLKQAAELRLSVTFAA